MITKKTILGVVVLADLDSYMVVAFFKTVVLVIVLALVHGIVFLPVLLSIFVTNKCCVCKRKKITQSDANGNGEVYAEVPDAQPQQWRLPDHTVHLYEATDTQPASDQSVSSPPPQNPRQFVPVPLEGNTWRRESIV